VYGKDNRLLPIGFDLENAGEHIAVNGEAVSDADFVPGGDRVALEIDLGGAEGPFTLSVELLYQSIAFRWAENIYTQENAEAQRFGAFYQSVPNLPLVVDRVEVGVE
jgi:hypothetical protein